MGSRLLSTAHMQEHKDLAAGYQLSRCALLVGAPESPPTAVDSEWEGNRKWRHLHLISACLGKAHCLICRRQDGKSRIGHACQRSR